MTLKHRTCGVCDQPRLRQLGCTKAPRFEACDKCDLMGQWPKQHPDEEHTHEDRAERPMDSPPDADVP